MRAHTVSALVLMIAAQASCSTTKHPHYETAAREARLNARSASGVRHLHEAQRLVGNEGAAAVRECHLESPDKRGAHILLRLDATGNTTEVIVFPESDFSSCVAASLRRLALPPPPRTDYWLGIRVPSRMSAGLFPTAVR